MKVLCLGGAGMICKEAIYDLVEHSSFSKITVADINEEAGRAVVAWLNDPRVDYVYLDVNAEEHAISVMAAYDIVMDGTTITLNGQSTKCIALAGCHGINLNGFGAEDEYDHIFRANDKTCLPGFGMTPGLTQMMAMKGANQLDQVESVRVSHGSFRPIAFSKSITETTTYEYSPELPGRVVFEKGEFIQVKPFARPMEIALPEPYGTLTQYIIPHSETKTLARALSNKNVQLIEVRGSWPKKNMALVKALYDWGVLRNDAIQINGARVGVMDCLAEYLMQSKEGNETELYGYALHVALEGKVNGALKRITLTHTHPKSDGSVEGWGGLRAYTRNVAIPMAIATQLIAEGAVKGRGVLIPEEAFEPEQIIEPLKLRGIQVHQVVEDLG